MWMDLKKGDRNPMLDAARAISLFGEQTPEEKALDEQRGPVVAASWEEDPRNPRNQKQDRSELIEMPNGDRMPRWLLEGDDAAGSNAQGSFESLMGGWAPSAHGKAFDTSGVQ